MRLAWLALLSVLVACRQTCLHSDLLTTLGIKPTTERPHAKRVILERNGWASHYTTTAVAVLLLEEALGFATDIHDDPGGVDSYQHCADGTVDANLELWADSNGRTFYDEWITQKGLVVDAGNLGVIGRSGWYVPEYVTQQHPDEFLDFWRAFLKPQNLALFPRSGTVPESLMTGNGKQFIPDWCVAASALPQCGPSQLNTPAYYGPNASCAVYNYSESCIELLGVDGFYDPGLLQQQIVNNGLNMTVPFLSENNFYNVVQARMNASVPVLFYYWVPSIFIVQNKLVRVALKESSDVCQSSSTANWTGVGGMDCDFPPQNLIKIHDSRLLNPDSDGRVPLADAVRLFQLFNIKNQDQDGMMINMSADSAKWHNDSFTVACQWLHANQKRWSSWIRNTPPREEVTPSKASAVVLVVAATLGLCWATGLHAFLVWWRKSKIVKASSYIFCHIIVFGSLLGFLAIMVQPFRLAHPALCSAYPALLSLSFTIAIGALVLKTVRLYLIFRNQLKKSNLTTKKLMTWLSGLVLYDVVVLGVWFGGYPLSTALESHDVYDIRLCQSEAEELFLLAICLPKLAMLVAGVWLAYRNRALPANFNESWYIAIGMYTIALLCALIFPVAQVLYSQPSAHALLTGLGVFFAYAITLAVIFVPKMLLVRNPPPPLPLHNTTSSGGTTTVSAERVDVDFEETVRRFVVTLPPAEVEGFFDRLRQYRGVAPTA